VETEKNRRFNENEEMEIDLVELFFLFRRRLKEIVISALVVGVLVGLYTIFLVPPKYQATSKLYIVSASNESVVNLSDLQLASSLTGDYQQLILSRPMMESTIKNLDLENTTANGLKNMLSISNPSSTRLINITATTTDPELSKNIANEVAKLAVSWLPAIMECPEPNIAEDAITPQHRSSPSYTKNIVIGMLAGAVLCYGLFVVQYLLDDTITSADDFEKYFGMVPLSSIPEDPAANDGSDRGEEKGDIFHRFRNFVTGRHRTTNKKYESSRGQRSKGSTGNKGRSSRK